MIFFVAPPLDAHVSGGNLFNEQILLALQESKMICSHVSKEQSDHINFAPGDVIIIDSIYVSALDEMFMDSILAQKVLLVHLLPSMINQGDRELEYKILQKFNRLIVNSVYTRAYCEQQMGFQGKIDILEPYIYQSPIIGLDTVRNKILLVATWQPVKQIDLFLLHLAKYTLRDDLVIDIYGDTTINEDYFQYCMTILEQFPELKAHIEIQGVVGHKDLLPLYTQSKILLDTSSFESFGMAVAEALAAGVMVISLGNGNTNNLVTPPTGILCKNMDELIQHMLLIHHQDNIPTPIFNPNSEARWSNFVDQVKVVV